VTITETTNLDQGDIEQMVRDAEVHADEDRRLREAIDARNELDSLAYRAEQLVGELQDRLPVNEKARAEQLIADARQAVQEQAGLDRVRPLIADLQQVTHSLPASASAAAGAAGNGSGGEGSGNGAGGETAGDDEEVVDAEFTRE
jgi:molecular chaperone DnaK